MTRISGSMMITNVVTLVATLALNGLATGLPLNGRTTGEISDSFPNVFAPAGYVFSIWGIIYIALIAFTVYQATSAGRASRAVQRIGWWFAISGVANSVWILFWHYGMFPATMASMVILLASLCVIASRIGLPKDAMSKGERWMVHLPFSIYLGWISVATIANAAVTLLDLGWDGGPLSPGTWTVTLIAIAVGLGLWFIVQREDLAYSSVLIWAFIGISVKQVEPWVPEGATIASGLLALVAVWRVATWLAGPRSSPNRNIAPGIVPS